MSRRRHSHPERWPTRPTEVPEVVITWVAEISFDGDTAAAADWIVSLYDEARRGNEVPLDDFMDSVDLIVDICKAARGNVEPFRDFLRRHTGDLQ